MEKTLLLRLAGPLQSWGIGSKYEGRRQTERYPTKSAVIGLLASALGRKRDQSVDDLAQLKFGVRIDREGTLIRDFHTAKANNGKDSYITNRYYLSDACFLAGVEGNPDLIHRLEEALNYPMFPLFLGRRSCPPEGRINLGIQSSNLKEALSNYPPLCRGGEWDKLGDTAEYRLIIEDHDLENCMFVKDQPVSYSFIKRQHTYRAIEEHGVIGEIRSFDEKTITTHDPMAILEEV
ncbi:type I-E CRISPR-associated protein Cas5/CasD [Proteiniclasticum sp. QWL-01]|uniref:type I-E CRISPR-associated protein Cas5/CasD n=1 Tax=Proteiniclasticum sp. QWL-01 TaxID=3036945 RepID=UPI00240EDBA1|nr:type I-E CRISPR-associated protein Cas5/CasD [Proteiniclasticum sp. QWL-01]WFF72817.1 type I-E CRISPR-associated protein Cas5/CasD [Proteiniclasticum sp. QWL-01]